MKFLFWGTKICTRKIVIYGINSKFVAASQRRERERKWLKEESETKRFIISPISYCWEEFVRFAGVPSTMLDQGIVQWWERHLQPLLHSYLRVKKQCQSQPPWLSWINCYLKIQNNWKYNTLRQQFHQEPTEQSLNFLRSFSYPHIVFTTKQMMRSIFPNNNQKDLKRVEIASVKPVKAE